MPHEYWLQKKAFNSWSHVTWYDSLEEARSNFNKVAVEGNGYSWRMVSVEVVEERLNHDERPVVRDEVEESPVKMNEGSSWSNSWRPTWNDKNAIDVDIMPKNDHGMIGKVWLGNPVTKEKKRVDPSVVDAMMKEGWVRAGPRTVL